MKPGVHGLISRRPGCDQPTSILDETGEHVQFHLGMMLTGQTDYSRCDDLHACPYGEPAGMVRFSAKTAGHPVEP